MRMARASPGISMLKMATGRLTARATFSAKFMAKLVFPIDGRPATMMRSEGWRPEVISSKSAKPVGRPVMGSLRWKRISMRSTALPRRLRRGWKPPPPRCSCSAISKTRRSASSSSSATSRPSVLKAMSLMPVPTEMSWRSTERSRTILA